MIAEFKFKMNIPKSEFQNPHLKREEV